MSEAALPTQLVGTVFFGRKLPKEQYANNEASVHIQFDVEKDLQSGAIDWDVTGQNISAAFAQAKARVFQELKLPVYVDEDGTLHEGDRGAEKVQQRLEAPSRAAHPSQGPPRLTVVGNDTTDNSPVPPCEKCGGAMWDNRPKIASGEYKPNAAKYRCKDKGCGHSQGFPERKGAAR